MGWQDDPVIESAAPAASRSWQDDPVIEAVKPAAAPPPVTVETGINGISKLGGPGSLVAEPAAQLATGSIALPIAGLSMLGAAGTNALGISDIDLTSLGERIQRALTYQPRTRAGKIGSAVVSYPFEKLAQGADYVGEKAAQVTGSPAVGAAVNTGVQLLPSVVLGALGRKTPAQQQAAAAQAEAAARTDVSNRTGLDFDALAQGTKETLTKIAAEPAELAKLDPAALERQARFESLPVPIKTTNARITRDPVALRNEANAAASNAGKPIRDTFVDNNAKLLQNIETLKGRTVSRGEVETGRAVQDAARAKLEAKKAQVDKAYTEARAAGELQGKVSPKPIIEALRKTADKSDLKWVETWLADNNVIQNGAMNKQSLETLEGLRRDATARVANGGSDGYHAGKIVRAIDQATDGAGGAKYKAARKARAEQALEFQDQAAVARLVNDKSRTDRSLALEDTWNDVVLRGSLDDLVKVKRSLLTGGDAATRTAGKNAWRDLRAETISYIEREATKGVQLLEDGSAPVSPAALKRAVDKIGTEKLDQIFGSGTRKKLDEIVTASRDLKTEPPAVHGGSSTMGNVLAFLEQSIGRLPGGSVVPGAVRFVQKLNKEGQAGRIASEAAKDPLSTAAAKVESKNQLKKLAPVVTAQPERRSEGRQ